MEDCEERLLYAVKCKAEMRLLPPFYQLVGSLFFEWCLCHLRVAFLRKHPRSFSSFLAHFDCHHKQDWRMAGFRLLQSRSTPRLGARLRITHPQTIKPLRLHDGSLLFTKI